MKGVSQMLQECYNRNNSITIVKMRHSPGAMPGMTPRAQAHLCLMRYYARAGKLQAASWAQAASCELQLLDVKHLKISC